MVRCRNETLVIGTERLFWKLKDLLHATVRNWKKGGLLAAASVSRHQNERHREGAAVVQRTSLRRAAVIRQWPENGVGESDSRNLSGGGV